MIFSMGRGLATMLLEGGKVEKKAKTEKGRWRCAGQTSHRQCESRARARCWVLGAGWVGAQPVGMMG